jgi:hypothetical protein
MSPRNKNRLALLVVAVIAIAAIGAALRSHSKHHASQSLRARSRMARVARFARSQAHILGDPGLAHATVILGPQTVQATGGVHLTKSEAYIVLSGRFHCDHCHDLATSALGQNGRWHARTLGYTVSWPTLAVVGIASDTRPDGLNLPPTKTIKRLTVVKL